MSKYGNKKVVIDGHKFDSRKEGARYQILKAMEKAGKIDSLELQPEYELLPKYRIDGRAVRAIKYRADFRYTDDQGVVIEDVKGMKTEVYKIKRKMLEYKIASGEIKARFIET